LKEPENKRVKIASEMKAATKFGLILILAAGIFTSCVSQTRVHRKPEKHRPGAMSKTLKKKGENCGCHN
jgi:hypothetical protein